MSQEIIKIKNLTKTFKAGKDFKRAVDNLSFSVGKGEIFGLIGPNGAGKTTTIKLTLGLLKAEHGEINIFGVNSTTPEVKMKIGYMPENPIYPDYLNGNEFLEYMGLLFKIDSKTLKTRIQELSKILGIAEYSKRRISTYSKGMVQRLFLAQALINNPELLILDEPTTGLDPLGVIEFRNILKKFKENDGTVLISSHNLTELEKICDRVVFLKEGRIIERVDMFSLKNQKELEICLSDVSDELLKKLKTENYSFRVKDTTLFLDIEDDSKLPSVMKIIENSGVRIESITIKQESLEELFIKLARAMDAF